MDFKTSFLLQLHRLILLWKSSVPASQNTYHVSVTKARLITLLREIIAVFIRNIYALCGQNGEFLNAKDGR